MIERNHAADLAGRRRQTAAESGDAVTCDAQIFVVDIACDREAQTVLLLPHPAGRASTRMRQRFDAAEVNGLLDLERVTHQPGRLDRKGPKRIGETTQRKERRIDAVRERSQRIESLLQVAPQFVEQRLCRGGSSSATACANCRLTASATRSCSVPSWRSRSILRRSASAAATSRAARVGESSTSGTG